MHAYAHMRMHTFAHVGLYAYAHRGDVLSTQSFFEALDDETPRRARAGRTTDPVYMHACADVHANARVCVENRKQA